MFALALAIGLYAYIIFFLGVIGLLYQPIIICATVLFAFGLFFFIKKYYSQSTKAPKILFQNWLFLALFLFIILQAGVNLIGTLGPELSFDSLWYHLTLPKVYLDTHSLWIAKSGILYYAYMPKILEMLYIGTLAFGSEIFAKLIHFTFGILSLAVLYRIGRRFFNPLLSLFAVAIFYSNPVVGWESISAYIDLGRTFFELLALLAFLNWNETHKKKWFTLSAMLLGIAITTKLLALGTLFIFLVLIVYFLKQRGLSQRKILQYCSYYIFTAFLIPFPWFLFSFVNTGNPFYPFFSHTYPVSVPFHLLNPIFFMQSFLRIFTHADDPISPIYLAILPLLLLWIKKFDKKLFILFFYSLLSLIVWYVTPQTGGGRFILPYLPILSLCVVSIFLLPLPKGFMLLLIGVVILTLSIGIVYRLSANIKFIPVILGRETKNQFLTKHLNFSFGDFVDSDGYFEKHIKKSDKVLLYGFHNLFYVDFPYIESTTVKKGHIFNYVALQNSSLPERFHYWNLVYLNPITKVQLYSAGGLPWVY